MSETYRIRIQRYNNASKHYYDIEAIVFKSSVPWHTIREKLMTVIDQVMDVSEGEGA